MNNKEYGLLKIISVLFKVFAVIVLIVAAMSFILILSGGGKTSALPKTASIIWLAAGIFYSTLFMMFSEIIKVLIRIERNTRKIETVSAELSPKAGDEGR